MSNVYTLLLALRVPRKLLMASNPVNLEVSQDSKRKRAPAVDERASPIFRRSFGRN